MKLEKDLNKKLKALSVTPQNSTRRAGSSIDWVIPTTSGIWSSRGSGTPIFLNSNPLVYRPQYGDSNDWYQVLNIKAWNLNGRSS